MIRMIRLRRFSSTPKLTPEFLEKVHRVTSPHESSAPTRSTKHSSSSSSSSSHSSSSQRSQRSSRSSKSSKSQSWKETFQQEMKAARAEAALKERQALDMQVREQRARAAAQLDGGGEPPSARVEAARGGGGGEKSGGSQWPAVLVFMVVAGLLLKDKWKGRLGGGSVFGGGGGGALGEDVQTIVDGDEWQLYLFFSADAIWRRRGFRTMLAAGSGAEFTQFSAKVDKVLARKDSGELLRVARAVLALNKDSALGHWLLLEGLVSEPQQAAQFKWRQSLQRLKRCTGNSAAMNWLHVRLEATIAEQNTEQALQSYLSGSFAAEKALKARRNVGQSRKEQMLHKMQLLFHSECARDVALTRFAAALYLAECNEIYTKIRVDYASLAFDQLRVDRSLFNRAERTALANEAFTTIAATYASVGNFAAVRPQLPTQMRGSSNGFVLACVRDLSTQAAPTGEPIGNELIIETASQAWAALLRDAQLRAQENGVGNVPAGEFPRHLLLRKNNYLNGIALAQVSFALFVAASEEPAQMRRVLMQAMDSVIGEIEAQQLRGVTDQDQQSVAHKFEHETVDAASAAQSLKFRLGLVAGKPRAAERSEQQEFVRELKQARRQLDELDLGDRVKLSLDRAIVWSSSAAFHEARSWLAHARQLLENDKQQSVDGAVLESFAWLNERMLAEAQRTDEAVFLTDSEFEELERRRLQLIGLLKVNRPKKGEADDPAAAHLRQCGSAALYSTLGGAGTSVYAAAKLMRKAKLRYNGKRLLHVSDENVSSLLWRMTQMRQMRCCHECLQKEVKREHQHLVGQFKLQLPPNWPSVVNNAMRNLCK